MSSSAKENETINQVSLELAPPSYDEIYNQSASTGNVEGSSGMQSINLLTPKPAEANQKCISINRDGGTYGSVSYNITDSDGTLLYTAGTEYKCCNSLNTFFLDPTEAVSGEKHTIESYGTSSNRLLKLENSESREVAAIIKHLKVADVDGNILKISNAGGQTLFGFKLIITQAMLEENNQGTNKIGYEVIANSEVIGKLIYHKGSRTEKKNYKFLYSLPLDQPTLFVILSGIFGLEDAKFKSSQGSCAMWIAISIILLFLIVLMFIQTGMF